MKNHTTPLCIDLDGTLIKTDLLLESFLVLIKQKPWAIFCIPFWLMKGKTYLKSQIADQADLDYSVLPYCQLVLDYMQQAKDEGRKVILATASHEKYAAGIAKHLNVFDKVYSTSASTNLSGGNKAKVLIDAFGDKQFDYAGNAKVDMAIWEHANKVIVVNPDSGVGKAAVKKFSNTEIMKDKKPLFPSVLKALRVHQWLKNILIFVPLIASHNLTNLPLIMQACLAFLSFGLCASSVYILNDLLDLNSDRHHATKHKRPFASGNMGILLGLGLLPVLLGTSIFIASVWLPTGFLVCLGIYYLLTMVYSFWAKNRIVIDVMFLAGLYTMRIIAGAAAIAVASSFWILAFSMFIFLSLAMIKRYSELFVALKAGKDQAKGRGYVVSDLPLLESLGGSCGYLSILVLALYINSPEVNVLYSQPKALWALCPILLFWISRVWFKTHRGEMHDDPIVFAAKDTISIIVLILCAVALLFSN